MHHHFVDRFAQLDSPVHRMDARAKLLAAAAYMAVLISFPRYQVAALAPMAILPLAVLWLGHIPLWFAIRRMLVLSPFVLTLCVFGPLYDSIPQAAAFGPWRFTTTGGWLAAGNVAVKFAFGIWALTGLTCTTPFSLLLEAMRRLLAPRALVMQLSLLYRYLFVLIDEAMRVRLARDFRGAALAPVSRRLTAAGGVVGALFVRTLERSGRVHLAMQARGLAGEPRSLYRLRWRGRDTALVAAAAGYLLFCRWAYPAMTVGT
jgi:cobalt/nickel transport system permease protein